MQCTGEKSDGPAWIAGLNPQEIAAFKERTVEALPTRNSEEGQSERYKHSIGVQSHKDGKAQRDEN